MSDAFFALHAGLPRQGPGDRESLDWALAQIALPPDARMFDAGCGPGADIAGLLAHAPQGQVVAMDCHAPFVAQAQAAFANDPRVSVMAGDMANPDGQFDLIWCAGALYFLGVTAALAGWRAHLRPGGAVVFSQIAWRNAQPAPAARAFWRAYPAMCDAAGVNAWVDAAGWRVLAQRFLPHAAWAAYYDPLQARIDALRGAAHGTDMAQALAAEQAEIDLWRAHGDDYGYLQIVAVPV